MTKSPRSHFGGKGALWVKSAKHCWKRWYHAQYFYWEFNPKLRILLHFQSLASSFNSIIHIVSNSKVHITNINYWRVPSVLPHSSKIHQLHTRSTMDNHRSSSSTDQNLAYHHCYGIIHLHLKHTWIKSDFELEIGLLGPEWHNPQSNGPNLYFFKACKQNIACAQS
jgi:hypothetical protein